MKPSIIAKLEGLQARYEEVAVLLGESAIIANQNQFRSLSREYAKLKDVVLCFANWRRVQDDIVTATGLVDDPELQEIAQEELKCGKLQIEELEKQLQLHLLPQDPEDEGSCFLEIRAGTGGSEAAIFAGDLFRMYSRYVEMQSWQLSLMSSNTAEQGGFKEVILRVSGTGAYGVLKFESGGHRVQRVPVTESQGRVHTSTCTVAVLPEVADLEVAKINPTDLKVDTFRSSGAGGQHVNTTDSAIRITHLPTGTVVECQDERSQHKNRAKAMAVLAARIHAAEKKKRSIEEASLRRNLLGSGERSDRIRTYNFAQNRVTDHRINLTIYRLEEVLDGQLSLLIDPLIQEDQADRLAALSEAE